MAESARVNRRRFLQRAPAGAAMVAAVPAAAASPEDTSRKDKEFRVGCLNVSAYSHLEGLWAPLINPRPEEKEMRFTGMRITHCWEIDRSRAEKFASTFGCQVVNNFDDMLGKVDGVISGGYYNHPWDHILHEPYLRAGLPNLINRPFLNSRVKAKRMIELARRHGATIMVPSAHAHTDATSRAKAWASGKKILCYSATNSSDDYPTHGIHGVYMIFKAIVEAGNPVVSVAYQAKSWHSPPGVLTFEHVDPEGRGFLGSLHQVGGSWATIRIHTPEEYGGKGFHVHTGTGYPFDKTEIWAPTIWAYQRMALFKEMPQTYEQLLEKNNIFLAGWWSILKNNGRPVKLEDVPEDWESPVELPNRPGDETVSLFRKKFG